MKNYFASKVITFSCFCLMLSASSSYSGNSIMGEARAKIVSDKLYIQPKSELNFGKIDSVNGGGVVVISSDCNREVLGMIKTSAIEPYDCASFSVNGIQNQNYTVHLPSILSFSRKEGRVVGKRTDLTVNNFSGRSRNAGHLGKGRKLGSVLDGIGTDDIYIGGSLVVPANAAPGTYIGEVPVTVSY